MIDHFKIRCAGKDDIKFILEIYAPFILNTAISFEKNVPSEKEMWNRISDIQKNLPFLVCEVDKKIAGYAYASNHRQRDAYRWSKEVSVYINPDFRKKQIATALYTSLFEILRIQGVTNLLAGVTLPNLPSVKFHEKMGFKKIAEYSAIGYKFKQWHNVGWWELNLNPELLPPNEKILPFPKISAREDVKNAFKTGERIIIL